MKNIFTVLADKVVTERKVQQSAPIDKKTKIGTILPKVSGGKIYEYNPETGEIKEAQFETKDYFLGEKNTATIIQKSG